MRMAERRDAAYAISGPLCVLDLLFSAARLMAGNAPGQRRQRSEARQGKKKANGGLYEGPNGVRSWSSLADWASFFLWIAQAGDQLDMAIGLRASRKVETVYTHLMYILPLGKSRCCQQLLEPLQTNASSSAQHLTTMARIHFLAVLLASLFALTSAACKLFLPFPSLPLLSCLLP